MTLLSRIAGLALKLPPRRTSDVRIENGIRVPMRDGIMLAADRYYAGNLEPGPVVLVRSPYGRSAMFGGMARLFAERGFQFFVQSCRGTFDSEGQFNPMRQERADGLDTLAWVRSQSWFAGRVYTYGPSYLGFTQWALARDAGHQIDAMALQVTLSNFRNETLAFGGFTQEGSLMWTTMMRTMGKPRSLASRLFRRGPEPPDMTKVHAHLPLRDLDKLATGGEVPWWQDWVGHGEPSDPWWQEIDHSIAATTVQMPTTMIGGWKDIFLPWQVKDFEAMQAEGREVWLTIGPWAHASPAGMTEALRQALALFTAHSTNARPFANRDRVRLYVQGANKWRDYPSWPPPGARRERLYLQPGGALSPAAPSTAAAPTTFVYDPADPTPSMHGPVLFAAAKKPDMSPLVKRADTISFTSAPLSSDMEAIGPVELELNIRSDLTHTDFYACLCDLDAAGRSLHVADGYLRLRPGEPSADAGGVRKITIACWPTAYRFRRGHRLRLIVASGAHPRYARNLGTGEPLGTGTRMVSARQEVFHDPVYPSALCVTLGSPQDRLPG